MKKVAVVILNWNGKKLLEKFLPALLEHTPDQLADCIVADNASTDDSLAFLRTSYPRVKIIPLEKNYGFAEGYNLALAGLEHVYAVLLNSDVEVTPHWLEPMVDYLESTEDVVAAQPKILSYKDKQLFEYAGASGGFLDRYGYPFCRGRVFETMEQDRGQYDDIIPVLWASGACMLIRLPVFREAGGFDPVFFAHQEEIDLGWRLNAQGKHIVCIPQSVVYHVGGATLPTGNPYKTFLNFRNNLLLLYKNLPEERLNKVLFVRYLLDYLAAFMFFMKGHPADAKAVFRAQKAFSALRPEYTALRAGLRKKVRQENLPVIYREALIWKYYIERKKYFHNISNFK